MMDSGAKQKIIKRFHGTLNEGMSLAWCECGSALLAEEDTDNERCIPVRIAMCSVCHRARTMPDGLYLCRVNPFQKPLAHNDLSDFYDRIRQW